MAIPKCRISNTRYTCWYLDTCQLVTAHKHLISNTRYTHWYLNIFQANTIRKCRISNTRYTHWYLRIHTSLNQLIGFCFNNRITITITVIRCIFRRYNDTGRPIHTAATPECINSNTRYIRGYINISKPRTIIKRILSNTRHTHWYLNIFQLVATPKCMMSNTCYTLWHLHTRHTSTIHKCKTSNARYTLWYHNARQIIASFECRTSNARAFLRNLYIPTFTNIPNNRGSVPFKTICIRFTFVINSFLHLIQSLCIRFRRFRRHHLVWFCRRYRSCRNIHQQAYAHARRQSKACKSFCSSHTFPPRSYMCSYYFLLLTFTRCFPYTFY